MRTLLFVGSLVLWTSYTVATVLIVSLSGPPVRVDSALLITGGSIIAATGSSLVVMVRASTVVQSTKQTSHLNWAFAVMFTVSAALTIVGSTIGQYPPWVPLTLIALTIICSLGPILATERYRRDRESDGGAEWTTPTNGRARVFRRMAITFVLTAAVSAISLTILALTVASNIDPLEVATMSLSFGAISATIPAIVAMFNFHQAVTQIFGTDIASRKAVGRVVVRGKPDQLTAEQTTMAARFAHVMHDLLPVQYAQLGFLLIGLIGVQAPRMLRGDFYPLIDSFYPVIGVIYVVLFLVARRQYRSVSAYARAHPLGEAALSPAP